MFERDFSVQIQESRKATPSQDWESLSSNLSLETDPLTFSGSGTQHERSLGRKRLSPKESDITPPPSKVWDQTWHRLAQAMVNLSLKDSPVYGTCKMPM